MQEYKYVIAGWAVIIRFKETDTINNIGLLPSFAPFEVNEDDTSAFEDNHLLTLTVDNDLRPYPKEKRQRIRSFDTGNGDTIVDKLDNGGYQYIIKNVFARNCALVVTNERFNECHCALAGTQNDRLFGLNNTLMLVFAFASSFRKTLLIHASVVKRGDYAFAFIAKSGTGKSTQVSNWLKTIPECELLNDDNPVVRVLDNGEVRIYGSPWSGKTPCYRNRYALLGGVCRIDRASENALERLRPLDGFASVLPSCSSMKWDQAIYRRLYGTVLKVVETIPTYILHCLPNEDSARVCCKGVTEALTDIKLITNND